MKTKKLLTLLLMLLALMAKADNVKIVATQEEGSMPIFSTVSTDKAVILYDDDDAQVVDTAIKCLIADAKAVSMKTMTKYKAPQAGKNHIIVGTIGQCKYIDEMIANGKLDVSDIKGKWEAYMLEVVDNPLEGVDKALVLVGSQPRSTAYAVFELTRLMGVSPWIWWADVTPTRMSYMFATKGRTVVNSPSVKFRGIFLNDEDYGLRPWAAKNMDKKLNNFGPVCYGKIMELLLRLKANTLWPAMHGGSRAFWFEKTNIPLINAYDIYMGSSHCEQMLRDNEYEWGKFNFNGVTGDRDNNWIWHSNQAMIKKYWADRVGESRGKNAIYTLGMRGVHDTGINGYSSTAEKVAALTDIIAYQRQLLKDSIGEPTTIPQIFIPYKEVLTCYNAGLQVPDDVTLMWVDDNHGYIRQMPTPEEQKRSGGNGIYYHLSYWGTPASYLWLSTISPSLCSYELCKAYDQGVRDQWIINVGDIKPAEEELEFCMDLAWDITSWTPENAYKYTRDWAARTFGEDYADEINDIKMEYYRLGIAAKPEHVQLCHFDYSNAQVDERIRQYQAIYDRTVALRSKIPSALRNAYYELIEYPVCACTDQNIKLLRARQSYYYAWAGQKELAMKYATDAQNAFNEIVSLTNKYNTGIASGKWNGMMNYKPNNWEQHLMPSVASTSDVNETESTIIEPNITILPGGSFSNASDGVKAIEGLGIAGSSATVWPLDLSAYSNYSKAPYAEYEVPVKKGLNVIQVRCLPTFPLNDNYDLRVGVGIDGKTPSVLSYKVSAMSATWDETVALGYQRAAVHYNSTSEKTIKVRTYFMDPGTTVSAVASIPFVNGDEDLTDILLTNADFEYNNSSALNTQGTTTRGLPKGWRATGTLNGSSWGVNNDAKHYYGINCYWASSSPMPNTYELYQTIAASKLEAGTYRVSCLLGTATDKMATCRLFANKNVQYYGSKEDYTSNMLTSGEINTFAGHGASGSSKMTLKPMSVTVTIKEGESLKLGIRTSNYKADGTRATSDNYGWFKVDHFRIQKVDAQDEADGIRKPKASSEATTKEKAVYDLSGRKINGIPTRKGIYIVNGRKIAL